MPVSIDITPTMLIPTAPATFKMMQLIALHHKHIPYFRIFTAPLQPWRLDIPREERCTDHHLNVKTAFLLHDFNRKID